MSIDGQVIASTFVDNASYGADDVRTGYGNTLMVSGSILASSEACAPGNLPTGSNNLTLSSTCTSIATEVSAAELNLGPLADNGGPTLTHLPGITSVAVDTGGDCGRTIDQRGLPARWMPTARAAPCATWAPSSCRRGKGTRYSPMDSRKAERRRA